ncbi:BTAD domain-containing putative transcriptional regulator [Streptomyces sp. NBC_01363]|uniref:AfsR/SARP family transcriptional regulator n=1 Tax=Streptomyces sp. NBC_01363 TaxID=2903840 RepID=UPI00224E2EFD|nr:BTAD domain-containing putative transcriptional regulator [Streptomyces sp. NBC_01363]MCX4733331.1 winged helix-turn-helix domain-containing protein [Streptomyces sp. NBC_01363]
MRFRLLGPLEVLRSSADSRDATPRAAKHRIILATLLVRAGEPVPTETLISELWGNTPPRTATTTIQVYISQLRKFLGLADSNEARQAIVTRRPGYLFRLDPSRLDLTRFEALHAQGVAAAERHSYAEASELQRRALSLWRGRFLADIPTGPLLSAEAARLSEMRLAAREQHIRAELRIGHHREMLGVLRTTTAEHPLREELHSHLMVALYRSGRQAEALQVFTALRRTLIDELAIEPGPSLQRLHQRVLLGDPTLLHSARPQVRAVPADQAPPAAPLPPPDERFAGRAAELDRIAGLLRGGATSVLVTGAAGAGKSALARQAAHVLADDFPGGRFLIDLRTPLSATPGALAERMLRTAGAASPLPDTSAEPRQVPGHVAGGRRVLFVLDNAGPAEELSDALPDLPGTAVLVTARQRPGGLRPSGTVALDLPGRADAEAVFVAACGQAGTQPDPEAVEEIVGLCGQLPLALRIAGARLAEHPHWTAGTLAERLRTERTRLGELSHNGLDVRASLLRGYLECDPGQRDAFRLLGVLPAGPFEAAAAAAVLGLPPGEAEPVLEQLVRNGLLASGSADGSAPAGYLLPVLHRLLAVELAEDDPADTRHAAVGRLCEAYARTAEQARPAPRSVGRTAGRPAGTAPAAGTSGPRPLHWFAEQQAALVHLVRAAADGGQWRPALRLARAIGNFLETTAAWDDWATTQQSALRAAEAMGDEKARAQALRALGDLAWQRRQFTEACRSYEHALRAARRAGAPAEEARALVGLADLQLEHGFPERARSLAEAAHAAAGTAQDPRARFEAERCQAVIALDTGRPEESEKLFRACLATAGDLANRRLEAYARRSVRVAAARREAAPGTPDSMEVRPGVWRLAPGQPDTFGGEVPEACGITHRW